MDTLQATYRDDEDDEELARATPTTTTTTNGSTDSPPPVTTNGTTSNSETELQNGMKEEPDDTNNLSEDEISGEDPKKSPTNPTNVSDEEEDEDDPPPKKQKQLSSLTAQLPVPEPSEQQHQTAPESMAIVQATKSTKAMTTTSAKKAKKKNNNVWTKPTSRKGKKKGKANNNNVTTEDTVLITPIPRFPDKSDDTPDMKICLSKVYKAEKVELSDDRMSAGSTKGYRMVRATRGVTEGAWYFEIRVVKLGETGHTRLGWSMEKGDLQAPVGYDSNSFGYRDIDGSKIHKALREKYGDEGYKEGDVIGFYINLPDGGLYAPKPQHLVWYKGQRYVCAPDAKEDPPKAVPESEISFFKNGVCQGVAFKDLYGGHYYPAASMYTLPNQPNCVVKFNFGPDFECFPEDFNGRPAPRPMVEVPYHGYDNRVENGVSNEKKL
ncbi:hypothetical protein L1049_018109 [Liquidambar formosana]|uniref:B30.2/SPRY domain-containing protein n=1 Tax=Liquidambar formosana TaxID=63359 RepID=A0AAP0NH85_LIQFO